MLDNKNLYQILQKNNWFKNLVDFITSYNG